MNRLIVFALASIAITALIAPQLRTAGPQPQTDAAATVQPARPHPAGGEADDSNAMVLRRDSSGQFHMTAAIQGEDVRFLVDTGADVVALTEDTAERLGLRPQPDDFLPVMKTASGTGYGARVTLDSVEIGGERFTNVEAVVMQGLSVNLLGQSVLRRLGKVELDGDSMVIRPS
ncbi:MAG: TIGR02281 family clan AA aspartic protease [Proteobacteria bacterium]|nr:TIGR02281 family clan AA aspartic protease [Pseudomonadota bacterium]